MAGITTTDGCWIFHAALCLFFIHGVLGSGGALVECNKANKEHGFELCRDAFKNSFEENLEELKTAAKRKGCCLSSSLGDCLEYSYTASQCDMTEDDSKAIQVEASDKQKYINNVVKYLGTTICGDVKRENCGEHLLHHFTMALKNITELNGAESLGLSLLPALLAGMVGTFHAVGWL